MASSFTERDRAAARQTHRLFWQANFVSKWTFFVWLFTRPVGLLIVNVLIPFQVAYALQAIITQQFDQVNGYVNTVLILGIIYSALWAIGGLSISRNGVIGTEYIQKTVFTNYLSKDYEFYNNTYLGSLGAQVTTLKDAFNSYCTLVMNGVAKQVVLVVSSIAIIAYHSPIVALVTVLSMVVILSFTIASSRWRLKYRRQLSEANSEIGGVVGDALGHGVTVKSFAAEAYEQKRFGQLVKKQLDAQYWSWVSSIPGDVGRTLMAAVATVILLVMTAHLYQAGSIPIAIVVLVQLYVIKLVNATHEIAEMLKTYEAIMSGAHQALKTMMIEPRVVDRPNAKRLPKGTKYDIDLRGVSYHYDDAPDGISAIQDFDLHIKHGERVGLVGYSGSGKTTLTKLLLRFMDISDGEIRIGNVDIRELTQKELRQAIAYVPQEPLLFHRSIADNIAYGKPTANQVKVYEAGKNAYVDEFVRELANGYDTQVGEKGVKLSGGQRQRVAIARALLKDAPILVLDEATSALDSRSEQYIQKALWRLMKGRTALVIAHRLSTIQRMDRIVVMEAGRIVEVGTHDELLAKKNGVYATLWSHQSGGYIVTTDEDDEEERK